MAGMLHGISTMGLVALLKRVVAGVELHADRWRGNGGPSLETLRALIARTEATHAEMQRAVEAAGVARKLLRGSLFKQTLETYQVCRDLVKVLYKSNLQDFGLKPRALPSTDARVPEAPEQLRLVRHTERTAFVDWKSQSGRRVYELFHSLDDPAAAAVFAGTSTSASMLLEGLEPGHTYYVRARMKSRNRAGPLCEPLTVVMPRVLTMD